MLMVSDVVISVSLATLRACRKMCDVVTSVGLATLRACRKMCDAGCSNCVRVELTL